MGVTVGIDLGSRTTVVAALVDGRLNVIPSRTGSMVRPSVLGRPIAGNVLTTAIAALVGEAAAYLGTTVDSVSVAVSGGMGPDQRQMVERALGAQRGPLRVYRTLGAAAGAASRLDVGRVVLIVDVGAATIEAAVVSIGGGVVECHAVGHRPIGGDDVDQLVADHLLAMVRRRLDPGQSLDPAAQRRVRVEAEAARRVLSTSRRATVPLFGLQPAGSEPSDGLYELTQDDIVPFLRPLVDGCRQLVHTVLAEAGSPAVEAVVAIGGASRTPAVRHMLRAETGVAPVAGLNPDTFVAEGVALRNGVLEGTLAEPLVVDALPDDLRLRLAGGRWPERGADELVAIGSVPAPDHAAEPDDAATTVTVSAEESVDVTMDDDDHPVGRSEVVGSTPAPKAAPALAGAPGMDGPDWTRLGRGGGRRTIGWIGTIVLALGSALSLFSIRADRAEGPRAIDLIAAPTTTTRFLTTRFDSGFNGGFVTTLPIGTLPTTTLPGGARSTVWYRLQKGDCILVLPPATGIAEVGVVGCDTSHAAQVFAVDQFDLLAASGITPLREGATTSSTRGGPGGHCYDTFEAAVGVPADQSPYEISYLMSAGPPAVGIGPAGFNDAMLANGTTICLLNRVDGAPLTQSVLVG